MMAMMWWHGLFDEVTWIPGDPDPERMLAPTYNPFEHKGASWFWDGEQWIEKEPEP